MTNGPRCFSQLQKAAGVMLGAPRLCEEVASELTINESGGDCPAREINAGYSSERWINKAWQWNKLFG